MGLFKDILSRKMPTPTPIAIVEPAAARDELAELQAACDTARARVTDMEYEVQRVDTRLADIAALANNLKIRISEHDGAASAALDALEKEELGIRRIRDGLQSRVATARHELAPLEARAGELAHDRDARRQDALLV